MKRTRLPSRHTPQDRVQRDGSPRPGSCCYGRNAPRPFTPCTCAPGCRRRAADGEVHIVFPHSGPGQPIRAFLAEQADIWRGVRFDLSSRNGRVAERVGKHTILHLLHADDPDKRRSRTPLGNFASTREALASTKNPSASTKLSLFVPGVEAVEANPTTFQGWFGSARRWRLLVRQKRKYRSWSHARASCGSLRVHEPIEATLKEVVKRQSGHLTEVFDVSL